MKTIKVPFPIYEGLEVKNATVDIENGVSVVEYGEKEIEDMPKDILVPEDIGIYKLSDRVTTSHDNGDGLYISFNEEKQVLFYTDGVFGAMRLDKICLIKVQCKLTPCSQKDLKKGDTAFCCTEDKDFSDIMNYMKVLNDGASDFVWIEDKTNISLCTEFSDTYYSFYKVQPIN